MSLDREVTPEQLRTMIDAVNSAASFEANHSCFDPRLNLVLAYLDAEATKREQAAAEAARRDDVCGSDHSASPAPPRVTIPEPDASASQQPRDLARRATPKSGEAEQSKLAKLKELVEKAKAAEVALMASCDYQGEAFRCAEARRFLSAACDPDTVRELIQAAERGMEYEKALKEIERLADEHDERDCAGLLVIGDTATEALASDPPQGKEEER